MPPPASSSASPAVSLVKRTDRNTQAKVAAARLYNGYLQDGAGMSTYLRYAQLVFVLICGILLLQLFHFSKVETRIFPTTVDGKMATLPPTNRDIGNNTVLLWVMDTLTQVNTMGYHDYQLRLETIRSNFTDRGWESFNRYLRGPQSNTPSLRSMFENDRLILMPFFKRPPEVVRKGLVGGVFTYDVRARLTMRRTAALPILDTHLILDINIERVPSELNPSGVAIARWRVSVER